MHPTSRLGKHDRDVSHVTHNSIAYLHTFVMEYLYGALQDSLAVSTSLPRYIIWTTVMLRLSVHDSCLGLLNVIAGWAECFQCDGLVGLQKSTVRFLT